MKAKRLERLTLRGLTTAPAQVHGAVRMVPLRRVQVRGDVRLGLRRHKTPLAAVAVDGTSVDELRRGEGTTYISVIPHAFIVRTSDDGTPIAALGTSMARSDERPTPPGFPVHVMHRMAKAVDDDDGVNAVRFAPLHLAVERLLSMAFAGPDVDWPEVSKQAFRHGLGGRSERAISGRSIAGLDEAIRTFELYDDQVGVAVFVDDVLASIFVVPHPDDWRALHTSLLEDFWCELFAWGGLTSAHTARVQLDAARVSDLSTLQAELARARIDDGHLQQALLGDVLERPITSAVTRTIGALSLQTFHTDLARDERHHVGEAIVRDDGTIEYLKTFRLTDGQSQRAFLLQTLARHQFRLVDSAKALRIQPIQLVDRIARAGFSYLFRPDVLAKFSKGDEFKRG